MWWRVLMTRPEWIDNGLPACCNGVHSPAAPVIVTGGPGGGKSTLLAALAELGYATFAEVPRQLIEAQSQIEGGTLPWQDLAGFAALCLADMQQQKAQASAMAGPVFLDRAIGDICAYLGWSGLSVPEHYRAASQGYHGRVFFCVLDPDSYVQDDVRPYPFSEALALHQQLLGVYCQLGYECIEVPWGSVAERCRFVLSCQSASTNDQGSASKIDLG